MIITIDGPVGTGKSTIAKQLARQLGFVFFDTGAMYRALTYAMIKHCIDRQNFKQLNEFIEGFTFEIKILEEEEHYFFEEEDITQKIRTLEVTSLVSEVSALSVVRDKLMTLQKKLAHEKNAVFEGRDMGTVVFPDAKLKIFLTGKAEIRAKRRFEEIQRKAPEEAKKLTFEECLQAVHQRDLYDSQRQHAPLRPAKDAHFIDTSDLNVNQIVDQIIKLLRLLP